MSLSFISCFVHRRRIKRPPLKPKGQTLKTKKLSFLTTSTEVGFMSKSFLLYLKVCLNLNSSTWCEAGGDLKQSEDVAALEMLDAEML